MASSDERRLRVRSSRQPTANQEAFEDPDEGERRALARSYALSCTLAALFLLFVHLTPVQAMPAGLVPERYDSVKFEDDPPEPPVETVSPPESSPVRPAVPATRTAESRADAFRTTPTGAADVADLLRNVEVGRASSSGAPSGSRTVLASGSLHSGTPGLGGTTGSDAGIGRSVTGEISRGAIRIPELELSAPPLAGPGRDVGALGALVRSRQAELQNCYWEHGLSVEPSLAGLVRLSVTLAADGSVRGARVADRSWSGEGSRATEECILRRIGSWRFTAAERAEESWAFSVHFGR